MSLPALDELAPGLWRWSVPRKGVPPTMTAYALRDGEDTILVDPLSGPLRFPKGEFVAGESEPLLVALSLSLRLAAAGGSGLRGLADRVEALGGTLDVVSPAGAGTSLCAEIPIT